MVSATILMSGGIDSTACAHFLLKHDFAIEGLYFDYGQAAKEIEEQTVKRIAEYFGIYIKIERALVGREFKEGELIGRNAFLIFSALMTMDLKKGILAIGIHSGLSYYDCSINFFKKINTIVKEYTDGQIEVMAPFLEWNKGEIIEYCVKNQIPLELTYSCERGDLPGCGECLSCKDRGVY